MRLGRIELPACLPSCPVLNSVPAASYVLDRRQQANRLGNMLPRPSLLLELEAIGGTSTWKETLSDGNAGVVEALLQQSHQFGGKAMHPSMSAGARSGSLFAICSVLNVLICLPCNG